MSIGALAAAEADADGAAPVDQGVVALDDAAASVAALAARALPAKTIPSAAAAPTSTQARRAVDLRSLVLDMGLTPERRYRFGGRPQPR